MSCLTAWIAALLILIGSVWSQEQILEEEIEEPRFGFNFLEPLRRSFCQNFCTSSDTMSYIANLACAVKCPELYLPHKPTEPSTATTPLLTTITQNPSTTTATIATTTSTPATPETASTPATPETTSTSETTPTSETTATSPESE